MTLWLLTFGVFLPAFCQSAPAITELSIANKQYNPNQRVTVRFFKGDLDKFGGNLPISGKSSSGGFQGNYKVQVTVDDGGTWVDATGTATWSYKFKPTPGKTYVIAARTLTEAEELAASIEIKSVTVKDKDGKNVAVSAGAEIDSGKYVVTAVVLNKSNAPIANFSCSAVLSGVGEIKKWTPASPIPAGQTATLSQDLIVPPVNQAATLTLAAFLDKTQVWILSLQVKKAAAVSLPGKGTALSGLQLVSCTLIDQNGTLHPFVENGTYLSGTYDVLAKIRNAANAPTADVNVKLETGGWQWNVLIQSLQANEIRSLAVQVNLPPVQNTVNATATVSEGANVIATSNFRIAPVFKLPDASNPGSCVISNFYLEEVDKKSGISKAIAPVANSNPPIYYVETEGNYLGVLQIGNIGNSILNNVSVTVSSGTSATYYISSIPAGSTVQAVVPLTGMLGNVTISAGNSSSITIVLKKKGTGAGGAATEATGLETVGAESGSLLSSPMYVTIPGTSFVFKVDPARDATLDAFYGFAQLVLPSPSVVERLCPSDGPVEFGTAAHSFKIDNLNRIIVINGGTSVQVDFANNQVYAGPHFLVRFGTMTISSAGSSVSVTLTGEVAAGMLVAPLAFTASAVTDPLYFSASVSNQPAFLGGSFTLTTNQIGVDISAASSPTTSAGASWPSSWTGIYMLDCPGQVDISGSSTWLKNYVTTTISAMCEFVTIDSQGLNARVTFTSDAQPVGIQGLDGITLNITGTAFFQWPSAQNLQIPFVNISSATLTLPQWLQNVGFQASVQLSNPGSLKPWGFDVLVQNLVTQPISITIASTDQVTFSIDPASGGGIGIDLSNSRELPGFTSIAGMGIVVTNLVAQYKNVTATVQSLVIMNDMLSGSVNFSGIRVPFGVFEIVLDAMHVQFAVGKTVPADVTVVVTGALIEFDSDIWVADGDLIGNGTNQQTAPNSHSIRIDEIGAHWKNGALEDFTLTVTGQNGYTFGFFDAKLYTSQIVLDFSTTENLLPDASIPPQEKGISLGNGKFQHPALLGGKVITFADLYVISSGVNGTFGVTNPPEWNVWNGLRISFGSISVTLHNSKIQAVVVTNAQITIEQPLVNDPVTVALSNMVYLVQEINGVQKEQFYADGTFPAGHVFNLPLGFKLKNLTGFVVDLAEVQAVNQYPAWLPANSPVKTDATWKGVYLQTGTIVLPPSLESVEVDWQGLYVDSTGISGTFSTQDCIQINQPFGISNFSITLYEISLVLESSKVKSGELSCDVDFTISGQQRQVSVSNLRLETNTSTLGLICDKIDLSNSGFNALNVGSFQVGFNHIGFDFSPISNISGMPGNNAPTWQGLLLDGQVIRDINVKATNGQHQFEFAFDDVYIPFNSSNISGTFTLTMPVKLTPFWGGEVWFDSGSITLVNSNITGASLDGKVVLPDSLAGGGFGGGGGPGSWGSGLFGGGGVSGAGGSHTGSGGSHTGGGGTGPSGGTGVPAGTGTVPALQPLPNPLTLKVQDIEISVSPNPSATMQQFWGTGRIVLPGHFGVNYLPSTPVAIGSSGVPFQIQEAKGGMFSSKTYKVVGIGSQGADGQFTLINSPSGTIFYNSPKMVVKVKTLVVSPDASKCQIVGTVTHTKLGQPQAIDFTINNFKGFSDFYYAITTAQGQAGWSALKGGVSLTSGNFFLDLSKDTSHADITGILGFGTNFKGIYVTQTAGQVDSSKVGVPNWATQGQGGGTTLTGLFKKFRMRDSKPKFGNTLVSEFHFARTLAVDDGWDLQILDCEMDIKDADPVLTINNGNLIVTGWLKNIGFPSQVALQGVDASANDIEIILPNVSVPVTLSFIAEKPGNQTETVTITCSTIDIDLAKSSNLHGMQYPGNNIHAIELRNASVIVGSNSFSNVDVMIYPKQLRIEIPYGTPTHTIGGIKYTFGVSVVVEVGKGYPNTKGKITQGNSGSVLVQMPSGVLVADGNLNATPTTDFITVPTQPFTNAGWTDFTQLPPPGVAFDYPKKNGDFVFAFGGGKFHTTKLAFDLSTTVKKAGLSPSTMGIGLDGGKFIHPLTGPGTHNHSNVYITVGGAQGQFSLNGSFPYSPPGWSGLTFSMKDPVVQIVNNSVSLLQYQVATVQFDAPLIPNGPVIANLTITTYTIDSNGQFACKANGTFQANSKFSLIGNVTLAKLGAVKVNFPAISFETAEITLPPDIGSAQFHFSPVQTLAVKQDGITGTLSSSSAFSIQNPAGTTGVTLTGSASAFDIYQNKLMSGNLDGLCSFDIFGQPAKATGSFEITPDAGCAVFGLLCPSALMGQSIVIQNSWTINAQFVGLDISTISNLPSMSNQSVAFQGISFAFLEIAIMPIIQMLHGIAPDGTPLATPDSLLFDVGQASMLFGATGLVSGNLTLKNQPGYELCEPELKIWFDAGSGSIDQQGNIVGALDGRVAFPDRYGLQQNQAPFGQFTGLSFFGDGILGKGDVGIYENSPLRLHGANYAVWGAATIDLGTGASIQFESNSFLRVVIPRNQISNNYADITQSVTVPASGLCYKRRVSGSATYIAPEQGTNSCVFANGSQNVTEIVFGGYSSTGVANAFTPNYIHFANIEVRNCQISIANDEIGTVSYIEPRFRFGPVEGSTVVSTVSGLRLKLDEHGVRYPGRETNAQAEAGWQIRFHRSRLPYRADLTQIAQLTQVNYNGSKTDYPEEGLNGVIVDGTQLCSGEHLSDPGDVTEVYECDVSVSLNGQDIGTNFGRAIRGSTRPGLGLPSEGYAYRYAYFKIPEGTALDPTNANAFRVQLRYGGGGIIEGVHPVVKWWNGRASNHRLQVRNQGMGERVTTRHGNVEHGYENWAERINIHRGDPSNRSWSVGCLTLPDAGADYGHFRNLVEIRRAAIQYEQRWGDLVVE